MFNVLRDDFASAQRPLADPVLQDSPRDAFTDTLGRHLFTYYLWDLDPLKGPGSLIERFYQQTGAETGSWGNLFDNMSRVAMDFEAEPLPVLSLYPMPESKALEDWSLPITEITGKDLRGNLGISGKAAQGAGTNTAGMSEHQPLRDTGGYRRPVASTLRVPGP